MEHVIFVHGTFAGSAEDTGSKWWQKGSDFANALKERLWDDVSCMSLEPTFHWSGKNSYAARRQAALDLITYVSGLEESKVPYHFVAHSHGGGVVWDALVLSEFPDMRKKLQSPDSSEPALQSLKSITTVGTPFLAWRAGRLGRVLEYIVIFYLFALVIGGLFGWVALAYGIRSAGGYLFYDIGLTPITELVLSAVVMVPVLSALIFPLFSAWTANQLQVERYHEMVAANHYGGRCLFLYSERDEAIQSLQAALIMDSPVIARISGRYKSPFDAYIAAPLKALRTAAAVALTPARWLHRRFIAPAGDRLIWSALRRNAYGADREGAAVVGVDVMPPEINYPLKPLPQGTTDALLTISQRGINATLPQIRWALSQFASGSLKTTADALSLDDTEQTLLVHTSYFECDDVVDLISAHIHRQSQHSTGTPSLAGHLDDYFDATIQARQRAMEESAREIDKKKRQMDRADRIRLILFFLILITGILGGIPLLGLVSTLLN